MVAQRHGAPVHHNTAAQGRKIGALVAYIVGEEQHPMDAVLHRRDKFVHTDDAIRQQGFVARALQGAWFSATQTGIAR